jgi:protein translocase SecG subunit
MKQIIEILQVVVSIALIIFVLFQQRGSGLGSVFGGGGEVYHSRRGFEKILFKGTIAAAFLFLILSLAVFLVD